VKQDEVTYPFLSLGVTGLVLIFVGLSERVFRRTRLLASFLALESMLMIPLWIYLLVFLIKDKH
jgi:hypothetical protein